MHCIATIQCKVMNKSAMIDESMNFSVACGNRGHTAITLYKLLHSIWYLLKQLLGFPFSFPIHNFLLNFHKLILPANRTHFTWTTHFRFFCVLFQMICKEKCVCLFIKCCNCFAITHLFWTKGSLAFVSSIFPISLFHFRSCGKHTKDPSKLFCLWHRSRGYAIQYIDK